MSLRLSLPLVLLTALPALAEVEAREVSCRFTERCDEATCGDIPAMEALFQVQKDATAALSFTDMPGTSLAMTYDMTPRGTVMANGTEGADMLFLVLDLDGLISLNRLSPSMPQEKLLGVCE